jgi:hypothetical protein
MSSFSLLDGFFPEQEFYANMIGLRSAGSQSIATLRSLMGLQVADLCDKPMQLYSHDLATYTQTQPTA